MKIETERLLLYPISNEEIKQLIEREKEDEMKQAYTEMLQGCLNNPKKRIWSAVWFMELKGQPGTIVGDFCFKGIGLDGMVEIGYGLKQEYRKNGYMTEAVKAVANWALKQDEVTRVEAEADAGNTPSLNVLDRAGFVPLGVLGEEGPRFVYQGKADDNRYKLLY